MGVGLVVIDGRGRDIRKLNEKIKTSRPSDRVEECQKYNQGKWFSGANNVRFPAYTSDENSHGQILFPGESVLYEITVSEDTLPYLDIRVESLNDDQMRDLNRLKAWLYQKRTTVRLERERADRRQKKEEEATRREAEQPALFDF